MVALSLCHVLALVTIRCDALISVVTPNPIKGDFIQANNYSVSDTPPSVRFARLHHHHHVVANVRYVYSAMFTSPCVRCTHCSAYAQQRRSPGAITLPVRYEVSYRLEVLLFHSHSLKLCGERCAENLAFRVKHSRMVGSTVAATYNQKNT
jgi:hypothetical protein